MVAESWFSRVFWAPKNKKYAAASLSASASSESEKALIGVLSFEVASLMSRVICLWQSLSDDCIASLRDEILNSEGVRKLVSDDDDYLVGLALAEMLDCFGFIARAVARLGKRCSDPVYRRLNNVFEDLAKKPEEAADPFGWEYGLKKMARKVKKMERFVSASASLYQEMEVLAELEQALKRVQGNEGDPIRAQLGNLVELQQKVAWQRQQVKNIRENSLWNRTYDYTVRLLVRSLFTVFARMKHIFGIHRNHHHQHHPTASGVTGKLNYLPRSQSISGILQSTVHPSEISVSRFASGPLGRVPGTYSGPLYMSNSGQLHSKTKRPIATSRALRGCITGGVDGSESPVLDSYKPDGSARPRSNVLVSGIRKPVTDVEESTAHSNNENFNLSFFSSKSRLLTNAPPSTLGAAALALHYANVIIVIEKFASCPHLIAPDARDDLYSMLPTSIRAALRSRLKSYAKNLASTPYDAGLAAEWTDALARILEWLAPLAHNMIRWQSERTFEQQHLVSKTNVLLLQTLFFANQVKTESAITELLVGLNYICRFQGEPNQKALLEAAGSIDFGSYLDANG